MDTNIIKVGILCHNGNRTVYVVFGGYGDACGIAQKAAYKHNATEPAEERAYGETVLSLPAEKPGR